MWAGTRKNGQGKGKGMDKYAPRRNISLGEILVIDF